MSLSCVAFGWERCVLLRFALCDGCRGTPFPIWASSQVFAATAGPFSLRMIIRETARLEDYGAQFGRAPTPIVVEVHEWKAGTRHRILQERDRRSWRKAMLAAQMEKSAD